MPSFPSSDYQQAGLCAPPAFFRNPAKEAEEQLDPYYFLQQSLLPYLKTAIALFEETRNVESHGGMMTDNGQRRRTPGGVFISLFKLDPDISEDVKKEIFGQSRIEARKMLRARRKGRTNFAEDVAKVCSLKNKRFRYKFKLSLTHS
ncbi:hypothetical protein OESDEN_08355 [Oesophagostomum dentatum]|uniref:Phosphorylated adapter RNA export protein n=1 Tax=Oesophagostomum dentatum TaxID=61180 RepID=A0A0B1T8S0_OESDE|nr:hypothetical protein OESDEN_08355 [Oesophagostomum dentatum]